MLTDNTFKPLSRMSFDKGQESSLSRAQPVSTNGAEAAQFSRRITS